jgi:RNA polymerase sigma-70 factor (ECF subfamily)
MSETSSFDELMARLRKGDDQAAAEVFRRYAERLVALARSRLDERLRRKTDADSVLVSVFESFFMRAARGDFELENWDGLWALLVRMTLRKCARRARHHQSKRRDMREEVPLAPAEGSGSDLQLESREPTPAEAVLLADLVERLVEDLGERDRPILVLRLQGHSVPEISEKVARSERTVQRVLDQVRRRLERLYKREEEAGSA